MKKLQNEEEIDMFLSVIDRQLHELNEMFDNFANWDKDKLIKLAQFYPSDFSSSEMNHLPSALRLFLT
jgi:hypothetical protein